MAKTSKKTMIIAEVIFLAVVAAVLAVTMFFCEPIELALGLKYEKAVRVPTGDADADYTNALKVHSVDVGQGDCTLVQLPDGKTMIIDGGENNASVKSAIVEYVAENFDASFKYFDYAILTHPDSDHCGSMDDVLAAYPARVSYRPNVEANKDGYVDPGKSELTSGAKTKDTAAHKNCIEAMYKANDDFTPVVHVTDPADESQTITGGEGDGAYTFTFYSPLSVKYTDWNNYSPIMILEYKGFRFAFSGDAEKENEAEFVKRVAEAKTDGIDDKYDVFTDDYTVHVIKAGHHGSRTSTSQAYIDAITTPEGSAAAYYIISCGAGNDYGHPHSETVDRLKNMGVPDENVLRTDEDGDFMLSVRSDNGAFKLFCNGFKTEYELAYKTAGSIELKWAVVAWCGYAVLVVITVVQMTFTALGGRSSGGRRRR